MRNLNQGWTTLARNLLSPHPYFLSLVAKFSFAFSINLILFTAITGCTSTPLESDLSDPSSVHTRTLDTKPTLTLTPFPASTTPSIIPSAIATPVNTPTATLAATEIPAITIPTSTPVVTIPAPPKIGVSEQILWLFETNNNCQLPCWWGITPGITKWNAAQEFISVFDSDVYEAITSSGSTYYETGIPLPSEIFLEKYMPLSFLVRDGLVEEIIADIPIDNPPPYPLAQYTLPMFLTSYGQPSEIWVFTYGYSFEGVIPFIIVLYYSDQGIIALFDDNATIQGDLVVGCPQANSVSYLSLWWPELDFTFEQVISGTSALKGDYLSLEESTEFDVEIFYEIFKDPNNTVCMETPVDIWP